MEFEELGSEIGALVAKKNKAYGDSFAKSNLILNVLFPEGVRPEQYRDLLAITRVIDKLFRIANRKDAFGENPWTDIAGYGLLGVMEGRRGLIERQTDLFERVNNDQVNHEQTYGPHGFHVDEVEGASDLGEDMHT